MKTKTLILVAAGIFCLTTNGWAKDDFAQDGAVLALRTDVETLLCGRDRERADRDETGFREGPLRGQCRSFHRWRFRHHCF